MAKMFYSAPEAARKIGNTEDGLKALVRDGKLREFRDAGSVNYKVADVDALAVELGTDGTSGSAASASGAIVLEPAEDSTIGLASSGSDILSLDESDAGDTAMGTKGGSTATQTSKEGSSVPSVGVNVFDDEDLDEQVDPLAQTAVTDVAGLGLEGVGSGSGIMELTRESDDTSLGQELLAEIYTPGEEGKEEDDVELGDATRAGLDQALPDVSEEKEPAEALLEPGAEPLPGQARAGVAQALEYGPDPVSSGLTALMVVAVAVMLVAGLGSAALVRGITPSLLQWIYGHLAMFAGAAFGISVVAAVVTYFLAKRSG